MTGTQISDMDPSVTLPTGAVVPFVVPPSTPGFDASLNYIYDLGADLLTRVSYPALAASGGATLVGTDDGDVQSDLDARPTSATLAASGGAALVGLGETNVGNILTSACYPETFGVVDDPNYLNAGTRIDQTAELQAWLDYAEVNRLTPRCHRPIRAYSSVSLTYNPSALIGAQRLPDIDLSNLTLAINATPGLVIGDVAAVVDGATVKLPNPRRSTLSWAGAPTDMVGGIVLINFRYCTVFLGDVRGFPVGHQYWSEGFGYTLNTHIGGAMKDNRFQEALVCTGADSYINENAWFGGSSGFGSDSAAQTAASVVGTYSGIGANGYKGSNNNRWYGRSYEGCESISHPNITECVPVWLESSGAFNYWDKCRVEAWRGPIMHVRGDVNSDANTSTGFFNKFDAGLVAGIGTNDGIAYVRQVAGAYANTLSAPEHTGIATWHSGSLRDVLHSGGGANAPRVSAPFLLREGTDATNYRQTSFSNRYQTNYFGIQMNNGVVGCYVDTSIHKDFEFTADTLPGNEGRWAFAAYDANFALLGATHTDSYATERNIKFNGATFSTLYGGVYLTGADGGKPLQLTVSDPVKYLFFGPASGTAASVCNGFGFKAFLRYGGAAAAQYLSGPPIVDPLTEGRPGIRLASANPATAGTHGFTSQGDIANNIGAASGQPSGWICSAGVALGVAFATSTAFAVKGQIVISDSGTKVYYVKTPGTTSGAGTGPNGTSTTTDYTDGTVVFRYLGAKAAFAALANVP